MLTGAGARRYGQHVPVRRGRTEGGSDQLLARALGLRGLFCHGRILIMTPEKKSAYECIVVAVRKYVAHALDDRVGALEERIAALESRPVLQYRGVYRNGIEYAEGSFATDDGSVWHAN